MLSVEPCEGRVEGINAVAVSKVSVHQPRGDRACKAGDYRLVPARNAKGAMPWVLDREWLRARFPSKQSEALFMEEMRAALQDLRTGRVGRHLVKPMMSAPTVLQLKLLDWEFAGGKMLTRIFFAEPRALPGEIVLLRLLVKRPGPLGTDEQTIMAREAEQLLAEFADRNWL